MQEGIKKVCRATIVEKWKKLTNEEKCRFGTMHEDPSSNVGERRIEKTDEEQKIGDKCCANFIELASARIYCRIY